MIGNFQFANELFLATSLCESRVNAALMLSATEVFEVN